VLAGFSHGCRVPRGRWSWWGRLRPQSRSFTDAGVGISSYVLHPRVHWARSFEHSGMVFRPRGGMSGSSSTGILPRFSDRRKAAATHSCGVSGPRTTPPFGLRHFSIRIPPYLVASGGSGCQISCLSEKLAVACPSPRRIAPGPSPEYFPLEVPPPRDLFSGPRERAP
jgi:hypothetical protein